MATLSFPTSMNQWSNNSRKYAVARLDDTHYVIAYLDSNSGTGKAILASISGTTITYGTAVQFVANSLSYISVTALDSTHFAIIWSDTSTVTNRTVIGVTDGATTISSYGTIVDTLGSAGSCVSICTLDSTHFAISNRDGGSGNSYVTVGTVSAGTTIVLGTRVAFGSGSVATNSPIPLTAIDSTHFACAYHEDSTNNNYAFICSVAVAVITKGTDSKYEASGGREIQDIFYVDSTHIGVAYRDNANSQAGTVIIGTFSGTTISSWGTKATFNAGTSGIAVDNIGSNNSIISYNDTNSGTAKSVICSVSGTTPSFSTEVQFDSQVFETGGGGNLVCSVAALDGTHFVTAFFRGTANTSNSIIGLMAFSTAYTKELTEVVVLVDMITKQTSKPLTEAITLVDTIIKSTARTLVDVVTLVDTVIKITSRAFTEVVTLVDSVIRQTTKVLTDQIVIIDVLTTARIYFKELLENVTIVDTIIKQTTRVFTEVVTLVDTFTKQTTKVLTDTVTAVDTFIKQISRTLTEQVTLVDTINKSLSRTFTEAITLVDTILKQVQKVLTEVVTLSDIINRQISKTYTETVTLVDYVIKTISRELTETITLVDTFIRNITRTFVETITLNDTVLKQTQKVLTDTITVVDNFLSALFTKAKKGIIVLLSRVQDKNVIQSKNKDKTIL